MPRRTHRSLITGERRTRRTPIKGYVAEGVAPRSVPYAKLNPNFLRVMAWRFLKLNPKYRQDYDSVAHDLSSASAKRLARYWGLKEMWDFRKDYGRKGEPHPEFRLGYRDWIGVSANNAEARIERVLSATELLLCFDLRAILRVPEASRTKLIEDLTRVAGLQLKQAAQRLHRRLKLVEADLKTTEIKIKNEELPRYLQAVELRYEKQLSASDITKTLPKSGSREKSALHGAQRALRQGEHLMRGGYLFLIAKARRARSR